MGERGHADLYCYVANGPTLAGDGLGLSISWQVGAGKVYGGDDAGITVKASGNLVGKPISVTVGGTAWIMPGLSFPAFSGGTKGDSLKWELDCPSLTGTITVKEFTGPVGLKGDLLAGVLPLFGANIPWAIESVELLDLSGSWSISGSSLNVKGWGECSPSAGALQGYLTDLVQSIIDKRGFPVLPPSPASYDFSIALTLSGCMFTAH